MISNQTLVAVRNTFKKLMFSLFFLGACSAFAQVGVGTQNPQTALHVAGVNAAASGTAPGALAAGDGVIVTRVTTDLSGGAVTTGCSAATQGALVYSTHAAGTGYYTCNGASWEPLSSGGGGGAASIRSTSSATITTADLNGYVIVTGNTTFDLSTLDSSANVGDTITFGSYSPTGFSVSANSRHANSIASPGSLGIGVKYVFDGTIWYSISAQ